MNKISTILVPFDFSKSAKVALEYAVAFVGKDEIQIILAHISGNNNFKLLPDNFLKLEKHYKGILKKKLKWINQEGSLIQTLLNIQKTEQIDLIIMGTSGVDSYDKIQQTNTSKLVLDSKCPVLAVPINFTHFKMKRVALVLGKSKIYDTKVLETLLQIIRRFNAKVNVITIKNMPGIYGYSDEEEKNEKALSYYLEDFYDEHIFIKNKDLVKGIIKYVETCDIDLIAILPRNRVHNGEATKGQLTEQLTLHSKLPLLAIE